MCEGIMTDQLLARIEKLERQNRRMKGAVTVLCLCLGALFTMGQTVSKTILSGPERIEAREIILSDGTTSAKLTPASLVFSAKAAFGTDKATVSATGISVGGRYATEIKGTGLTCSRDGMPRFEVWVGEIGAQVVLKNAFGHMGLMLDETTMVLINNSGLLSLRPEHLFLQKGDADALLSPTSLKIRDAEKYKAILGHADAAAPKAAKTPGVSAASVTLLGKDDTVLWQAP
jgi:hypothetical protein